MARLLSVLDKHTEIATKSKLNADYVPGMVTVLEGRDLLTRGMRDVAQALSLVPGIAVTTGGHGAISVSVRGLSETFGYASNQFMLNGVLVNNVFSGNFYPFLGIPIAQVERIEVIRGPGSAVHGGYANTGVINVVTRTEGNSIYGEAGRYETYGAGGIASWSKPDKDFRASLNLSGRDTDGADTQSGTDKLYCIGQGDISNAPGPANEDRFTNAAIMDLAFKNFSFIAQYLNAGHGDYFGGDNALPPDRDSIAFESKYWILELNQRVNVSSALWFNAKLGYMSYDQSSADRVTLYPPGFTTPAFTYPNGMDLAFSYDEDRYQGAINMTWEGWNRHRIFAEWSISQTYQGDDTWREANFDIDTTEPSPTNSMQHFDGALIGKDRERRINSIVVQEEFSATDTFDITAGLRFDGYNDTDDSLSPRLAGVWRLSDAHIFKVQYAQAYMPPSFQQLYHQLGSVFNFGNTQLKPQTSENFELGYIYRRTATMGRITLFHSNLNDVIVREGDIWVNSGGARLTGAELELEQSLLSTLKLDGNVSYSHTEDEDTDEPIPRTANWLANLGLSYQAHRNLILNAHYRYVGKQNRDPQDARGKADASHTIDVTGSVFNLFIKKLALRAGIQNVFNEDVRYAAPINTYPEDYPQPGRTWWAELSYDF